MNITHQTVIGDNGKPSAVIIPWDVFQKVREMLEGEPTPEEAEAMKDDYVLVYRQQSISARKCIKK